jgi:hypothetical protein
MTFDSEDNSFRSCEWLGSWTSAWASAGAQNPISTSISQFYINNLYHVHSIRIVVRTFLSIIMEDNGYALELAAAIQTGMATNRFSTTSKVRLIEASSPDSICMSNLPSLHILYISD